MEVAIFIPVYRVFREFSRRPMEVAIFSRGLGFREFNTTPLEVTTFIPVYRVFREFSRRPLEVAMFIPVFRV